MQDFICCGNNAIFYVMLVFNFFYVNMTSQLLVDGFSYDFSSTSDE